MTTKPTVTVIIPSYNQAPFIRRTLDSILEQSYRPLEIWVIDGASTDGTVDVLREYDDVPEVNWISEPDKGVADAVNKGIARASGTVAGIQSSDDYYLPGAVEGAMAAFAATPGTVLVYGDVQTVDEQEVVGRVWQRPPHDNALCIGLCVCIPQSSAFFDVALAREVGGWRDTFHTADWDFWIRLMFRGKVTKVDAVWSAWRVYPGQRTGDRRKVFEDYRRMIDASEDIAAADKRVRRAARASKELIGVSFDRSGRFSQLRYLLAAAAIHPPLFAKVPYKLRMVPGIRGRLRPHRSA